MMPKPSSVCREFQPGHDKSYNDRLRLRLEFLIQRCGTFLEVCSEAEGASPCDVLYELSALSSLNRTTKLMRILQTATDGTPSTDFCFGNLENLLIDYDWRFDKATAERLYQLLREFECVLCIGTPTVFALLRSLRRQDCLIDQNPLYSEILGQSDDKIVLEAIESLRSTRLNRTFSAILLDPPWYLNSYKLWISAGLNLLEPGEQYFSQSSRDCYAKPPNQKFPCS
jgi:hypothetical protein